MLSIDHIKACLNSNALKPWIAQHPGTPLVDGANQAFVYKTKLNHALKIHHVKALNPDGSLKQTPAPAVVYFFGGGWRSYNPPHFAPQARELANYGLHGFLVEYRTLQRFEANPQAHNAPHINDMFSVYKCISDARSAMRYIRDHAIKLGVDEKRIAAAGGSAGGHLALCVNLLPYADDPEDNLSISCRSDLLLLFNPVCDTTEAGYGHLFDPRNPELSLGFHPPAFVDHPDAKLPPMLLQHGEADTTTPLQNAMNLKTLWEQRGKSVTFKTYPGRKHGFFNKGADYRSTLDHGIEFLAKHQWLTM